MAYQGRRGLKREEACLTWVVVESRCSGPVYLVQNIDGNRMSVYMHVCVHVCVPVCVPVCALATHKYLLYQPKTHRRSAKILQ